MEQRMWELGVVPVAVINDAKNAVPLAHALSKGGLPCVEVTFRTNAAEESIRHISETMEHVLVGAGTVLSASQAERAIDAGARFVMAPGFDAEVVDVCLHKGVAVFPGCATASEITQAYKRGLRSVKFFPCTSLGGLATIKALAAPFAGLQFVPTGGISESNVTEYLMSDKVLACGGSWVANAKLIDNGRFEEIVERAHRVSLLVKAARL